MVVWAMVIGQVFPALSWLRVCLPWTQGALVVVHVTSALYVMTAVFTHGAAVLTEDWDWVMRITGKKLEMIIDWVRVVQENL
jgi:hypothetical protein